MTILVLVLGTAVVCVALATVTLSYWQRHRFSMAGGTFRCRVRAVAGSPVGWRARSSSGRARAVWIHDVLMVQSGWLFPRVVALPVRLPEDSIREAEPGEVTGLGRAPMVIELRLDDGPLMTVAAADRDRTLLAGPFLAAAVATLKLRR